MTARFRLEVLGLEEFQRAWDRIPFQFQRAIFKNALIERAAPIVLGTAKALAPVRTGKMRNSLQVKPMKIRRGGVGVMVRTGTRSELGIAGDDRYYYPMHVELGHRKRTGDARVPEHPYLRPALRNNESTVIEIVRQTVADAVRKANAGTLA